MPGFLDTNSANGAKSDLLQAIRKYERSVLLKAAWQLANTFIPYILLCILMYFSYKEGFSYWIILGLAIVAGGLLVRIFIFFHDCAHQSYFASRKANTILGYL
jgi:omega-6 fatty acid desaturase (delta-12 desaturase)